ncbi:MAG: hypothetical protein V7603_5098 [Micromonosporaceae bacterium]
MSLITMVDTGGRRASAAVCWLTSRYGLAVSGHRWWRSHSQSRVRMWVKDTGIMTSAAAPTQQPTPAPQQADPVCCGEGGAWAPAGQALVPGCMLCAKSPSWWRSNRADGKPYRPVPPLGSQAAQ